MVVLLYARASTPCFRSPDCAPQTGLPRVHDLRHQFAIQVLRRWYEAGADVRDSKARSSASIIVRAV